MAIIIPSKNIYERENKKIIDNAIENINFQENIYTYNIIQLYENENIMYDSILNKHITFLGEWGTGGEAKRVRFELECTFEEYSIIGNSSDIIRKDEIKLQTNITTSGNEIAGDFNNYEYLAKNKSPSYEMEDIPLPIPFSTNYNEIAEFANEKIKNNICYTYEISDNNLKVFVNIYSLKSITVYLAEEILNNGVWGEYSKKEINVSPIMTNFFVFLYLNYSTINSTAITIGKNGFSYQLRKNELLQKDTLIGEERISNYISQSILSSYKNGKETATLLCSISDYYNEEGEKVISIDSERMSFRMYDKVLPMVYSIDKQDVPMSKMKNGEPKYFVVIGSEIYYDGAVWQKIYLQEA